MWMPIMLHAQSVKPVIVGSGAVACSKAATLSRYGIRCTMVSPVPPAAAEGIDPSPIWVEGRYSPRVLADATLVIAATDDAALNRTICEDADKMKLMTVNASEASQGSAAFPMAGSVGEILLAVSTGGASPGSAGVILADLIETLEQHQWPERIRLLGELRQSLKRHESDAATRQARMRDYASMDLETLRKRREEYED
jgi:precorrin-2 dehydrogenase/sirohydrochlorin ferrochelatase